MPCPFFTTSGGGYCNKAKTFQSAVQITQYCGTDSNWQRCANYTGSSCFLTTACVHHAGLPDDCEELTGMRNFRDNYLLSLPNGQEMYDEYYRLAPAIVDAIECSAERTTILNDILERVRRCVRFVDDGANEAAFDVYTAMFNEMKDRFVSAENRTPRAFLKLIYRKTVGSVKIAKLTGCLSIPCTELCHETDPDRNEKTYP